MIAEAVVPIAGVIMLAVLCAEAAMLAQYARLRWEGSTMAAGRRWRKSNEAARDAGCPCGRAADTVKEDHGTIGATPQQSWTCEEHVGAGYGSWYDEEAGDWVVEFYWDHAQPCPLGRTVYSMSGIDEPDRPYQWSCPHQSHDPLIAPKTVHRASPVMI